MTDPDVLRLDEPFPAIDQDARGAVYAELLSARALWNIPFVLVTHDRAEAERLGDRLVFLRGGRLVEG